MSALPENLQSAGFLTQRKRLPKFGRHALHISGARTAPASVIRTGLCRSFGTMVSMAFRAAILRAIGQADGSKCANSPAEWHAPLHARSRQVCV